MGKKKVVPPGKNAPKLHSRPRQPVKNRVDKESRKTSVALVPSNHLLVSDEDNFDDGLQEMPPDPPRFEELRSKINKQVLDTIIEDLGFEHMTPIQAATIEPLLSGKDLLGQARTGTGKTIAFLLPAIESLLKQNKRFISLLVISPTRELVGQIAVEAQKLLKRFPNVKVATAIGGTDKLPEAKRIYSGCQVLVATPGRLLDHLADEHMQYGLSALNTLVLDEADRMLDMGFLPDVKKIIAYLPAKNKVPRQSMLFSATVPAGIIPTTKSILNPNYQLVTTIPQGETNTHEHVPQYLITVPEMVDIAPALIIILNHELKTTPDFKAIIFAPTTAHVDYYTHILRHFLNQISSRITLSALHSRMKQNARTGITASFRAAKSAICVATDVIARGMDFPLVTHVIQVGLPMNREAYIHRLGRTARADASGRGIFILGEAEKPFIRDLKDINFQTYPGDVDFAYINENRAFGAIEEDDKRKIYQGWLGYYKAMSKYTKWTPMELVAQANRFAMEGLGCAEVPGLEKGTVNKMGLTGVKGLVVVPNRPRNNGTARRPLGANHVNGASF